MKIQLYYFFNCQIQQPCLWYYRYMTFLLDHVVPRKATDSLISACDANESQAEEMENETVQENNVCYLVS